MATATLRPPASGLRSGYDNQQHVAVDTRTAACGELVREQRYDRPDWPRCLECIATDGITVSAPEANPVTELEQRAMWGDR